jgi:hypothetical protein
MYINMYKVCTYVICIYISKSIYIQTNIFEYMYLLVYVWAYT